jgi:hypothetical protein
MRDNDRVATTGNPTLDKWNQYLYFAQQGRDWFDKGKAIYREKTTWTVTVDETDTAYAAVQAWLLDTIPQQRQKNVSAETKTVYIDPDGTEKMTRSSRFDPYEDDDIFGRGGSSKVSETRVVLSLAETAPQKIIIGGHKVRVGISQGEQEDDGRPRRGSMKIRSGKIVFTCRSIAAQDAVLDHLNNMVGGRNKRKPALWVADGWGQWRSQDAPARKLSSVVLKPGLKEDLQADVQKFLDDERKYTDLGIPWHRGYLFHGPAGTGKTSLIKALAAELGLDLWYAPLGDMKEDSSLVDLVRAVKPRGVLLLEDVDSYAAARDRDSEGKKEADAGLGVSTSALLNALDGVVTPHGLITIMTTNHFEKLDPALIRNGRADRVVKLDLPTMTEIKGLWEMFFPEEDSSWIPSGEWMPGKSQAAFSEAFKRHWENPDAARMEVEAMLAEAAEEYGSADLLS